MLCNIDGRYKKQVLEHDVYIVRIIGVDGKSIVEGVHVVCLNIAECKVQCTCKLFERDGKLCSHALKVLDPMNIMDLPEHYTF
jgi:hypothetical protein